MDKVFHVGGKKLSGKGDGKWDFLEREICGFVVEGCMNLGFSCFLIGIVR